MDKSSSIWLPRSRYCRTIEKNTCAAIVGRLGHSSRLGRFGPPIEVICQLCSSVVYGTLTWTSLHRSGYPDPGIVGPYTNVTKKESLTCAAIVGRLGRIGFVTARSLWSSHRSHLPAMYNSAHLIVYVTLTWTSLHRSGYPDPYP